MKSTKRSAPSGLNRRHFLRAGATAIALPTLEAFSASAATTTGPRTFVSIGTYLGWYAPAFFPKQSGTDYEMPALLEPLEEHREHFTIFSGLDHRAPNGHDAWSNYLSGNVPGSYSVDQMIADALGEKSRFPSLHLIAGASEHTNGRQMSYTKQGVPMPEIERPSVLYRKLFMSQADRARAEYVLTSEAAARLTTCSKTRSGSRLIYRSRTAPLGEYFDSVRSVEKRMNQQISSINEPIPQPDYKLPESDPITPNLLMEAEQVLYDLMALAIQTESTRVITFGLYGLGQVFTIDGRRYRRISRAFPSRQRPGHGARLGETRASAHAAPFGLHPPTARKKDAQGLPLLDSTIVLVGTGMGDASRHSNQNLPTMIAGGGFQHGRHIAIDREASDAPLLGDLYITLMQRLGMETDSFSNASRNMNQLFS
ncbi:MAG: DUF1552 domain-containing protein [Bryobacterales bacterium]